MVPIITHPERNAILQRGPERVLEWVDTGCLVQVTASALTGHWGAVARRVALWLLDHDAVHVLATDAHDDQNRPPILSEARDAVSKRFGADAARALVLDNPAAIVAGRPLPVLGRTPLLNYQSREPLKGAGEDPIQRKRYASD